MVGAGVVVNSKIVKSKNGQFTQKRDKFIGQSRNEKELNR